MLKTGKYNERKQTMDKKLEKIFEDTLKKSAEDHFNNLREMSYPCKKSDGFGMIIEIRSTDEYGIIGNKDTPAYAHIYDINSKPVGEIVITVERPTKPNNVIPYRCFLPDGYRKKIRDWAIASTNELKVNNWDYLKTEWNRRRPD
jgi:hypothetical protein